MNVTIIGSGNMGSALTKQFAAAGHQVTIVSRNAESAAALARETGAAVGQSVTGDIVIVATSYNDAVPALQALDGLSGKIVVDITNPLTADYMGLTIGHHTSAAEEIQRALPQARVVKAFNTVFAQVLAQGAELGGGRKVPVYVASDDAVAKETVVSLAGSAGFDAVDAGGLKNARYLEPLAGLNIYFGYGAGHGVDIVPAWIKRAA